MTETLFAIGKAALAGYLAIVALAWLFQDHLLFFPQPLTEGELRAIAARHPQAEEVRLPAADGITLHGWLLKAAQRAPLLIYFGGNAEEVSWLLDEAQHFAGYSLLLMNYRGYGGSGGRPGETALYADALRIHDYAVMRPDVDTARIVLMGRSLGSAMAVRVATARRSVRAVLLVSPLDSATDLARRHYPWLPVSLLLRHRFEAVADAARIDAPLLAVVAQRDSIIPMSHSRRLYAAWHGPKAWREIENADHNDVSDTAAYWQAIGEFLAAVRGT